MTIENAEHQAGCECQRCKLAVAKPRIKTAEEYPDDVQVTEIDRSGTIEKRKGYQAPPSPGPILLVCLRCGYGTDPAKPWIQRRPNRPRQCWKCKTPYWDRPRMRAKKETGPARI